MGHFELTVLKTGHLISEIQKIHLMFKEIGQCPSHKDVQVHLEGLCKDWEEILGFTKCLMKCIQTAKCDPVHQI